MTSTSVTVAVPASIDRRAGRACARAIAATANRAVANVRATRDIDQKVPDWGAGEVGFPGVISRRPVRKKDL